MIQGSGIRLMVLICFFLSLSGVVMADKTENLFSAPLKIKNKGEFYPLSARQQQTLRPLVQSTLQGQYLQDISKRWQQEHWLWQPDALQTGFWLQSLPGHEQGQGVFWIRANDLTDRKRQSDRSPPILLQAPHRFYDRYTGRLVTQLTEMMPSVRASAWNSLHRYHDKDRKTPDQDLARQDDTLFNLFALEFAHWQPNSHVVQFHGYNHKKRRTVEGTESRIILSNGTSRPNDRIIALQRCLAQTFKGVRLYGHDIDELGATVNITGKRLRQMSYTGFVHIELSLPVRKLLLSSPDHLNAISVCLSHLGQESSL